MTEDTEQEMTEEERDVALAIAIDHKLAALHEAAQRARVAGLRVTLSVSAEGLPVVDVARPV